MSDERLLRQLERVAEAEKLLKRDAVISGMSQFVAASMRGDVEEVKRLLEENRRKGSEEGFDINEVDEESQTALHWASFYNESKVVDLILTTPGCDANTRNKRGATALHQAVIGGAHSSISRLLLDPSVDINAVNCWGETPLILSSQTGDVEAARLLLKANAKLNIVDKWQQSALDVASDHDEFGVLDLLKTHLSSSGDQASAVGMHVAQKEASHVHPLKEEVVIKKSVPRVLAKLMEAPLSDEQFSSWLQDPLMDVIGADFYGWRPVHKCAAWNKLQSLQALLDHPTIKALVDHKDFETSGSEPQKTLLRGPNGDSPLHCALEMGANETAIALCSVVDEKIVKSLSHFSNNDGVSSLMMAVAVQNISISKTLLDHGADPLERSKRGDSALSLADRSANNDLVSLIRSFVDPSLLSSSVSSSVPSPSPLSVDQPAAAVNKLDRSKFAALSRALSKHSD